MRERLSLLVMAAALGACGPTRFQSFCERTAEASCRQAFRCTPDDAKRLWTDVGTCAAELKTRSRCDAFATDPCTLDGTKSARCLLDLENAPCTSTAGALPESCRAVSCSTGNKCARVTNDASSGGCSYTLSDCTDQNTYGVLCVGSACSCQRNGSAERTFTGTCGMTADARLTQLATECSFDVK